jgi:hypothetical protein
VYGISVWNIQTEGAIQDDLVITRRNEPIITVDNLEVAQFIYLLLNNKKIRDVIDTITSKVALVLGHFTEERKKVLDALREELRQHNYTPVVFDFEKPASRDLTETVSTLAHLARFIIVDLTDPSSAPHEVATIIPQCIVPVQPLLLQDDTTRIRIRDVSRPQNTVSLGIANILLPGYQQLTRIVERKYYRTCWAEGTGISTAVTSANKPAWWKRLKKLSYIASLHEDLNLIEGMRRDQVPPSQDVSTGWWIGQDQPACKSSYHQ